MAHSAENRLSIVVTDAVSARMKKYSHFHSDGCTLWVGSQRNGYGAIKIAGKVFGAHCVAFVIAGGVIPDGYVVGHKCDVKLCVNPEHLEAITVQQNNRDAHARRVRTAPRGEQVPNATLTEEIVLRIKSLHQPRTFGHRRIANLLGVSDGAVKKVLQGRTWSHVKQTPRAGVTYRISKQDSQSRTVEVFADEDGTLMAQDVSRAPHEFGYLTPVSDLWAYEFKEVVG